MKKKIYVPFFVIVALVIVIIWFVVYYNRPSYDTCVTTSGGTVSSRTIEDHTNFSIELNYGGLILFGREMWNAGEEIVFHVSADTSIPLELGIISAEDMNSGFDYNDYHFPICKTIQVGTDTKELSFVVPKTGEYGLNIYHVINENTSTSPPAESQSPVEIVLNINKIFHNPLVSE